MDVVIIFNGLGNQMSQYAFYLQKKKISSSTRFIFSKKSAKIHNGYELDKVFGIKYHDTCFNKFLFLIFKAVSYKKFPFLSTPLKKMFQLIGIEVIDEKDDYNFKPDYLNPSKGIKFYAGGWHSEKYFKDIEPTVRNIYQFDTTAIGQENAVFLKQIESTVSVSVHVRRGDFLDPNNYKKFGAVCTLDYFLSAIKKIREVENNPHFYFFTNDVEWVKNNFIDPSFTVVNINGAESSWKDMFLISKCAHHINSNSSFSWWSSWLNTNENKLTIVPKNFIANKHFRDIYPEKWIQLQAG